CLQLLPLLIAISIVLIVTDTEYGGSDSVTSDISGSAYVVNGGNRDVEEDVLFKRQWCPVRDADYAVGCSVSKSGLPVHSYVVDSTVSPIETNVELASNIVTNSSLGDRILNVGMT
ncbi:hypothetical protein Tco_1489909, partial [Tanacetum coccineum]